MLAPDQDSDFLAEMLITFMLLHARHRGSAPASALPQCVIFRRIQRGLSVGKCPLRSESDRTSAHKQPDARQPNYLYFRQLSGPAKQHKCDACIEGEQDAWRQSSVSIYPV